MTKLVRFFLLGLIFSTSFDLSRSKYQPNWDSLDKRPIPTWYDESKFGIFMHWGVYAFPGMGDAWFWWYWKGEKDPKISKYMHDNYKPGFDYADFGTLFTSEFFNADEFAGIIKKSGARYVQTAYKFCIVLLVIFSSRYVRK